eukprot:c11562_g1_i1 orf=1654-1884(+)
MIELESHAKATPYQDPRPHIDNSKSFLGCEMTLWIHWFGCLKKDSYSHKHQKFQTFSLGSTPRCVGHLFFGTLSTV